MEVVYYEECSVCHLDFKVGKDSQLQTCSKCRQKLIQEKAEADLAPLLGGIIIKIKMRGSGGWANPDELETIQVKTTSGKIVELKAGGWEERYIEWEKLSSEYNKV